MVQHPNYCYSHPHWQLWASPQILKAKATLFRPSQARTSLVSTSCSASSGTQQNRVKPWVAFDICQQTKTADSKPLELPIFHLLLPDPLAYQVICLHTHNQSWLRWDMNMMRVVAVHLADWSAKLVTDKQRTSSVETSCPFTGLFVWQFPTDPHAFCINRLIWSSKASSIVPVIVALWIWLLWPVCAHEKIFCERQKTSGTRQARECCLSFTAADLPLNWHRPTQPRNCVTVVTPHDRLLNCPSFSILCQLAALRCMFFALGIGHCTHVSLWSPWLTYRT